MLHQTFPYAHVWARSWSCEQRAQWLLGLQSVTLRVTLQTVVEGMTSSQVVSLFYWKDAGTLGSLVLCILVDLVGTGVS